MKNLNNLYIDRRITFFAIGAAIVLLYHAIF